MKHPPENRKCKSLPPTRDFFVMSPFLHVWLAAWLQGARRLRFGDGSVAHFPGSSAHSGQWVLPEKPKSPLQGSFPSPSPLLSYQHLPGQQAACCQDGRTCSCDICSLSVFCPRVPFPTPPAVPLLQLLLMNTRDILIIQAGTGLRGRRPQPCQLHIQLWGYP